MPRTTRATRLRLLAGGLLLAFASPLAFAAPAAAQVAADQALAPQGPTAAAASAAHAPKEHSTEGTLPTKASSASSGTDQRSPKETHRVLDASATRALLPASTKIKSITVDDTAGVLNEARLRDALKNVKFNKPTKVAIYTRKGEYEDSINDKTLAFAKSDHPEWISKDPKDYGDYWADGYFILGLNVESASHGQLGSYYGEDRAVSDSTLEKIHAAGTDNFHQGRWTDGIADVVKEGSKLINRPWYKDPFWYVISVIVLIIAGIIAWALSFARASGRKTFDKEMKSGVEHLTQVSTDLDTTELAARTLPKDSPHAADLERRFADFIQEFRKVYPQQQELEAVNPKHRHRAQYRSQAKAFADAAADLDFTDDAIIQASALYTRSATWEDAWRAQTAPLLEDLDQLDSLTGTSPLPLREYDPALASFREEARTKVDSISADLTAQRIDVEAALDGLAELRTKLTQQLERVSENQIRAIARTPSERNIMREQMRSARYGSRRSGTGSILDVTTPSAHLWRMAAYQMGYSSGYSHVQSSRQSSSSSSGGVSHGYSGGSFSGSGGSTRF